MLDSEGWGQAGIKAHKMDTSHCLILILAACAVLAQHLRFSGLLIWGLKFHVPLAAKPLLLDPQTLDGCRGARILLTLWPWFPAKLENVKKHILLHCLMTVLHTRFSLFPYPITFLLSWLTAKMASYVLTSRESKKECTGMIIGTLLVVQNATITG